MEIPASFLAALAISSAVFGLSVGFCAGRDFEDSYVVSNGTLEIDGKKYTVTPADVVARQEGK